MSAKYLPSPADDIAAGQGWNDDSLVMLLSNFIQSIDKSDELATYLSNAAADENAEELGDEDTADDNDGDGDEA